MYEIWVRCVGEECEDFESDRIMDETDDAIEAIRSSQILRDNNHETWIVTKTV